MKIVKYIAQGTDKKNKKFDIDDIK